MYRTAAFWFGTSTITDDQFQQFKRIAVIGVAGATATVTMLISFISHAIPRERGGRLIRAIRAYFARKRKNVVRTVVKIVEKPVEKIVEVEKHIIVDRPIVVEKRVDVPGPERIVTEIIAVPTDPKTGLALDGGSAPAAPKATLHAVGGRQ
jgi:hypothetical protein